MTPKQINRAYANTMEEYENYIDAELFTFIDTGKAPDLAELLYELFHITWIPRNKKDRELSEKLLEKRVDWFGKDHIRSSAVSVADVYIYGLKEISRKSKHYSKLPLEQAYYRIAKDTGLIDKFKSLRDDAEFVRWIIPALRKQAVWINTEEGEMTFGIFGIPRDFSEYAIPIDSQIKQFLFIRNLGPDFKESVKGYHKRFQQKKSK